jgi:hypothetical protein
MTLAEGAPEIANTPRGFLRHRDGAADVAFDRPAIHPGLCRIARDARKGSVKFAPEMKKNRAIAAPACAPLGMDAFTRAQYEWGCGLPRRSHSSRR